MENKKCCKNCALCDFYTYLEEENGDIIWYCELGHPCFDFKFLGGPIMANDKIKLLDDLRICGCGNPDKMYKFIHEELIDILKNGINLEKTDNDCYLFMVYQLNDMGFLEHGCSVYGSWVSQKGKDLIKVLDEMKEEDYDYIEYLGNLGMIWL